MIGKTIRHRVDLANLPPMSEEVRAQLLAIRDRPDSEIDLSDIPELDEKFWQNAIRNPYFRPTKTATTVRIDSDVLRWLRAQGKGYQTRMNAILRREMLNALSSPTDEQPAAK